MRGLVVCLPCCICEAISVCLKVVCMTHNWKNCSIVPEVPCSRSFLSAVTPVMQVYAPGAGLLVRMLQDRKLLLGDTSSAAVQGQSKDCLARLSAYRNRYWKSCHSLRNSGKSNRLSEQSSRQCQRRCVAYPFLCKSKLHDSCVQSLPKTQPIFVLETKLEK